MTSQVATYVVDDVAVAFEIEPVAGFVPAASREDVIGEVRRALTPAVTAARAILDQIAAMAPDQVEIRFGIKVSGTTNWLIAKAATEGNFDITMSWSPAAHRWAAGAPTNG